MPDRNQPEFHNCKTKQNTIDSGVSPILKTAINTDPPSADPLHTTEQRVKTGFQVGIAAFWACACVTGLVVMHRVETTGLPPAANTPSWPVNSPISRSSGRGTILMAIHPRCSCTKASLEGLRSFTEAATDPVDVVCLATIPEGADSDWTEGPNCQLARSIPGVTLILDPDGRIAAMHGLNTSGEVAAFDRDGKGFFTGGLTPGRGLAPSRNVVATLLDSSRPEGDSTPVFGCALVSPALEALNHE